MFTSLVIFLGLCWYTVQFTDYEYHFKQMYFWINNNTDLLIFFGSFLTVCLIIFSTGSNKKEKVNCEQTKITDYFSPEIQMDELNNVDTDTDDDSEDSE